MLKTCHLLLAALLCLSSTALQAAARKDTTAISFFKPAAREGINPAYDFQILVAGAISKIKHDSTAQGVDDLLAAMKVLSRSKQVDRVLSPSEIEMVGILQMMQSADADAKDRKLGYEFVKGAFGELDSVKVLQFEKILSKSTETPFSKRLRFYIDYFTPKKFTEGMALAYLRKNPKSFFATMIMAHNLYMTGRYAEGIEYCNRVIEDKPTYAIAYKLRGKCYVGLNLAATALASYQQALQLFPTFVEANYDMGELLMDMDREEQAKDNFLKMYAIKPDYKWCTYHLARAYRAINQLDSALYYVNETIRNNPNDGFGYDMKGQIYTERNDYKTAINFYNQAITLEPQRGRFFEHRGDALANDHQFDKALLDFTFASLLDKTRIYPLLRLGDCYLTTKNYTQAIDYFEKAIALKPTDTYSLVGLNRAYTHFENYPEAIAHGLKAIATDSTYALAWGNLGRTYYCASDFNKCILYSNKAIALEKNSTYAMFNVTLATLRKGEVGKATDLYRQFVKTCRDNDYPISSDAADDLKELIAKHIYEKEAQQIINELFGEKAQG